MHSTGVIKNLASKDLSRSAVWLESIAKVISSNNCVLCAASQAH